MSKPNNPAGLNGSSDSIIIKNDSYLDISTNQTDSEALDNYDLEVQKPSERAKIINDKAFFKKLSYSFYPETLRSSKSLSSLPKHYTMDLTNSDEPKKPNHSANSEPISLTILKNLDTSRQIDERSGMELGQHNEPKAFKIKTLQNFHNSTGISAYKKKPMSPSNTNKLIRDSKKFSENLEPTSKGAVDIGKSSLKQETKASGSVINLDKYLKPVDKSPPTAKISLNIQSTTKPSQMKVNENVNNHTERSTPSENVLNNTVNKMASPRSTKLLFLSPSRTNESKKDEKTTSKILKNNNSNSLNVKDSTTKLAIVPNSRNSQKKK